MRDKMYNKVRSQTTSQARRGTNNCYRIYNHVILILMQVQNDVSRLGLRFEIFKNETPKRVRGDKQYRLI